MFAADAGTLGDGPAATDHLRRVNTASVLRALRDAGPASRSELARVTGLAKATVGTIVGRLCNLGAAEERAVEGPARGRPARPVALTGGRLTALGVEVNVDYLAAVAYDLAGNQVLLREDPTSDSPDPARLSDFVQSAYETLVSEGHRVLAVTVAVPGLVDRARGHVHDAPNLGWHRVDLAGELRGRLALGCPVRVDNDANCAALAEALHGAGTGMRSVLYLTGTIGIGAGVVTDGEVFRGGTGFAGEVGHMRLAPRTSSCSCGRRGCWETAVGLRGMLDAVGVEAIGSPDPMALGTLVAARADDDAGIRAGLEQVARSLAEGTAILANAFSPSIVVLGGYFTPLSRYLLPEVQRALDEDVFPPGSSVAVPGALGIYAAATGAAQEIRADVFAARVPLPDA